MTQPLPLMGHIFFDTFIQILYTPVWWYTKGVRWVLVKLGGSCKTMWAETNIALWMKNLFVPMYGQRDAWSRGISIALRFITIVAKLFQIGGWCMLLLCLFFVWVAAPLGAAFLIFSPIISVVM